MVQYFGDIYLTDGCHSLLRVDVGEEVSMNDAAFFQAPAYVWGVDGWTPSEHVQNRVTAWENDYGSVDESRAAQAMAEVLMHRGVPPQKLAEIMRREGMPSPYEQGEISLGTRDAPPIDDIDHQDGIDEHNWTERLGQAGQRLAAARAEEAAARRQASELARAAIAAGQSEASIAHALGLLAWLCLDE